MTAMRRHRAKKMLLLALFFIPTILSALGENTSDTPESFSSSHDFPSVANTTMPRLREDNSISSDDTYVEITTTPDVRADLSENSMDSLDVISLIAEKVPDANGTGRFTILHSPNSIKFSSSILTSETLLPQIYLASLGVSVNEKENWNGLHIWDPFNMPRAAVQITVDGFNIIENAEQYANDVSRKLGEYDSDSARNIMIYKMKLASYQPNTFAEVRKRLNLLFTGNQIVKAGLSDSKKLSEVLGGPLGSRKLNLEILQHLNIAVKEDTDFLEELANLGFLSWKIYNGGLIVPKRTKVDFYDFKFTSMHPLVDHHGPNSPTIIEARGLLLEGVNMLRDAFVKSYSQAVLVALVTTELTHDLRSSREMFSSALRDGDLGSPSTYSPDFPVIFNIVLWLFVTIGLAVLAICTAFMQMAADVKPICIFAPKRKEHKMEVE